MAPTKQPQPSSSALARLATVSFWDAFADARYDDIPSVQRLLTAAYLENPADPKVALLLGHTHLWKIAERARLASVPPEITDHLAVAERYFTEAGTLAPDDARIPGWLGAVKLALGNVHRDERLTGEGYYLLKRSAADVPHFHLFTFSFVMMNRPHDSPRFAEGVEATAKSGVVLGPPLPSPAPGSDRAAYQAGRDYGNGRHVCYNGRIPHNLEGSSFTSATMAKSGQRDAALSAWRRCATCRSMPRGGSSRRRGAAGRGGWLDDPPAGCRPEKPSPVLSVSVMACTGTADAR